MYNRVCKILGIKYPIIQGAMQWISDAAMVSAVANAGCLGVLATADRSKDDMRKEIKSIRKQTDKPFAVNISLVSSTVKEIIDLVIEEKVPLVALSAGDPTPFLPRLKAAGIKYFSIVATVRQALKMEELGASLIVAEGQESGGHIGEMTTMAFIPQVSSQLKIPVVAAGGIADGRGMAAAFILGAEGIQMGTVFIASKECTVHENFKKAVIEADSGDLTVTGRRTGSAVRCLKNNLTKGFHELDTKNASPEEYAKLGTGASYQATAKGDILNGSVMLGQIVGLVDKEYSISEIVQKIMNDYNRIRLN